MSADGHFVSFESSASNLVTGDGNGVADTFVHDLQTGATERVSVAGSGAEGNGASATSAISADGRYIAFYSSASNLVSGDSNGVADAFVHDRQAGTTVRVNVTSSGLQTSGGYSGAPPAISADGRYVAFESTASNLVAGDTNSSMDIFVHDCLTGVTERASAASDGSQAVGWNRIPSISADGRYVAFSSTASNLGAGWGAEDVFIRGRW